MKSARGAGDRHVPRREAAYDAPEDWMNNRVRIGTCSGPAEAAFVRSVFDAHELPVVINGEMHASTMGGLGGFVRLDIFVDQDDAEQAIALLEDIRQGEHAVSEGDELPDDDDGGAERDERADADGVWQVTRRATASEAATAPDDAPGAASADTAPASDATAARAYTPTTGFDTRRRRTGVVLLLSVLVGFGSAHMATGAWGRGIVIAIANVLGIVYAVKGDTALGGWLLFGARFGDMFGALVRVWSRPDGGPSRS
jgi:Putative prokaryotic signal transducing protein